MVCLFAYFSHFAKVALGQTKFSIPDNPHVTVE